MTKLQDFLNADISALTRQARPVKAGDLFGIELECEGRNVDYDQADMKILQDWAPHHDGSLRERHGSACEWVFNGPVNYRKSLERIDNLFNYFEKRGSRLVCSNRTSTHVHFNMGDKVAYQAVNMFILFTILEGLLDSYCGEDRAGNLFCLSSRHAEAQLQWVENAVFKHFNFAHFQENNRYCSFNLSALNKFSTVEFRGMRGLDNKADMVAWLNILNEFCEYACYKMKNPIETIHTISMESPVGFVRKVFSEKSAALLMGGHSVDEINHSIYDGVRLVQMLCFKIGTEFEQVRLRGRDFWASFKDDKEPELDIRPEDVGRGGKKAPRAGINPFAERVRPQPAPGIADLNWGVAEARILNGVAAQAHDAAQEFIPGRAAAALARAAQREQLRRDAAILAGVEAPVWAMAPEDFREGEG